MFKITNKIRNFNQVLVNISKRNITNDKVLKEPCVIMCNDTKHILCYHPEPEHPFEFTRPIERKIENDSVLKQEYANLYLKRFDSKPAESPREHWVDAIRLANTFNEHPIVFKRANRDQRVKKFLAKVNPIKKNRESI